MWERLASIAADIASTMLEAGPQQIALNVNIPDGATIGTKRRLTTVADTRDPLEAASFVRGEVRSGRASDLCRTVAGRAAPSLARIEVVTETHDTVARTRDQASLRGREVHATCAPP